MFRQLTTLKGMLKAILLGLIVGLALLSGKIKYLDDQNDINYRISQVQRQQEMLLIAADNPLPALAEKVIPSVVFIKAPGRWTGSGVIVGASTVLTARHIVQFADQLFVETADGETYKAINWVEDKKSDCALVFFDPRKKFESVAKFADSNELQVGDVIFTVGSPYGKQLFNTVTLGIISGLHREISFFGTSELLTSDAAINPGNSGGPAFDMEGRIVGITVGSKYGATGLSIIVPSNICKRLLNEN